MHWNRWKGWTVRTAVAAAGLLVLLVMVNLGNVRLRDPAPTQVTSDAATLSSFLPILFSDSPQPRGPFDPAPADLFYKSSEPPALAPATRPVDRAASSGRTGSPAPAAATSRPRDAAAPYRRSAQIEAALDDLRTRDLLLPLASLTPADLRDSFDHARGGGTRRHHAIDLPAPRGTPILAVVDGVVLELKSGGDGGTALVAADADRQYVFYYAHLQEYHPRMKPGRTLARGDTIGYVGTTGNAPDHMPHLHFAILRSSNLIRWSSGTPINPAAVWRP